MLLDIRTLVLLGALTMAVSTATFFSLYRFRFADRSPLAWGVSSAVITCGCVLLAFRDMLPPLLSIVLANMGIVFGYALIWVGLRLFMERPVKWLPVVAAPLLLAPWLVWFTYVEPSMIVRSVVIRLFLAVIPAMIWYELARGGPPRYGRPQLVLGRLYAVETVLNFGFGLAPLWAEHDQNFLISGLTTALFLLASNVYMLIHVLGVTVLYGERFRRELAQARDAAEAGSRAKGRFLAHMSHELRTPLNALVGMLELARSAGSEAERRDCLDIAAASAQSLTAVANDVLDLSRLEAGKLTLRHDILALAPALDDMLAPYVRLAAEQGLAFSISVRPEQATVEIDAARLGQIARNLVGNALKFTARGRIDVTARLDGHRLTLAVADTGSGIAADMLERVFDDFSQTEEGAKHGGAGLGLTISRQLARLMGGDITVESRLGAGARFVLTLPCRAADPAEAASVLPPVAAKPAATTPMHILVVDDAEPNRLLLATLLGRAGHAVTAVADGEAGVEAAARERFDLILMDIGLPGIDGLEAARRIRTAGQAPPIAALTAYALPGDRERFLAAGMDEVLTKPIAPDALSRALARFAPGTPNRGAPEGPTAAEPTSAAAPPGAADGPSAAAMGAVADDGIDWDRALELMGGHAEDLAELCAVVGRVAAEAMTSLRQAAQAGDQAALAAAAHQLRPSFLGFGATRLAETARNIELAVRGGDSEAAVAQVEQLARDMEAFTAALLVRART